jgi:hypothetical protein
MNKERLFEIFSKVNKLPINEVESNDLKNEIIDDIKRHFSAGSSERMFNDGISEEILINIQSKNIVFNILDEGGFELTNSTAEQNEYNVKYKGNLSQINENLNDVIITVPIVLDIEKQYFGDKIGFKLEIWIKSDNVQVNFN